MAKAPLVDIVRVDEGEGFMAVAPLVNVVIDDGEVVMAKSLLLMLR